MSAQLLTVGLIVAATQPSASLYIREPFWWGGVDVVSRLKVMGTPGPTESGVIDFLGQRRIAATTQRSLTGTAYANSTEILRSGQDESPVIGIDDTLYVGGNHRIGAYDTVSYYGLDIEVDGCPFGRQNTWTAADEVKLTERYIVPTPAGVAMGAPPMAAVTIERLFRGDGFCRFKYRLDAVRDFNLAWLGGMQAMKPVLKTGQTLHLIVPGSSLSDGVDITNEAMERTLPADCWDDGVPPAHFVQEIRQGGVPQWAFAMGYDQGQARSCLDSAFLRSAPGKLYPRFAGPQRVYAGASIAFSGYLGVYSRLN